MQKTVALKIAASTLVLGLTMVGCKPATSSFRPQSASSLPAGGERDAAQASAEAHQAVRDGDLAKAMASAERAVELSPQDVGYRSFLADTYLKSGRFVSAEAAYSDVLTLDPGNVHAGLSIALSEIAQGKAGDAVARLDALPSNVSAADVGLAYALAGKPARAIELLEAAARSMGANARVRQNLALAYAIAGDWQKARVTASQDLSPAEVGPRLQQWASFASPEAARTQVATLLGTSPVEDPGLPTRLALAPAAPAPDSSAYAASEAPAPVAAAPAVEAPVAVAAAAPAAPFDYKSTPAEQQAAAVAKIASVELPSVNAAEASKSVSGAEFAAAVDTLVNSPVVTKAAVRIAPAPVSALATQGRVSKRSGPSRYVVQIGAYRTAPQVEKAWAQAIRRFRLDNEPLSTTVSIPGKGTFYRLAVSGFDTPLHATRTCHSIRDKGGACFVRVTAGDAPVRWASRYDGARA